MIDSTAPAGSSSGGDEVTLAPRFWVPLGVILLGAGILSLRPFWDWVLWPAGTVALFGVFLVIQAALLRIRFTDDALLVLRGGTQIRAFPYESWLGWKVFVPPVPVLFYFREQRSIHLLPVLFDASTLRHELEQRVDRRDSRTTQ